MEEISIEEMVKRLVRMQATHKKELKEVLPTTIGNAAVNIFVQNFNEQGFDTGTGIEQWKEVKRRTPGTPEYKYPKSRQLSRRLSGILIRSGKGRRAVSNSLRSPRISTGYVVIPFEVASDYMAFHNYGTDKLPRRQFMADSEKMHAMVSTKIRESYDRIFTTR